MACHFLSLDVEKFDQIISEIRSISHYLAPLVASNLLNIEPGREFWSWAKTPSAQERSVIVTRWLALGLISLGISGCHVGGFEPHLGNNLEPWQQTGGTKPVIDPYSGQLRKLPYTTGGFSQEFEELKKRKGTTSDEQISSAVRNVTLKLLDGQGRPTRVQPQLIDLTVYLRSQFDNSEAALRFRLPVLTDSNQAPFKAPDSKTGLANDEVFAQLTCRDHDCVIAELVLRRESPESHLDTVMLITLTESRVRIQNSKNTKPIASKPLNTIKSLGERPAITAERTTVMIDGGRSFSHIEIQAPNDAEAPPLVVIETDLLATHDGPSEVQKVEVVGFDKGSSPSLRGDLLGNNYENGDIVLSIEDRKNSNENLLIFIESPRATLNPDTGDPRAGDANKESAFLKIAASDPKLKNARQQSIGLSRYNSSSGVQAMVNAWTGQSFAAKCNGGVVPNKRKADGFFTHAAPLRKYVYGISRLLDVTPEIAYILPIESEYAVSGSYQNLVVNQERYSVPENAASGPWQIQRPTALDQQKKLKKEFSLEMKIFPVVVSSASPRKLNPRDDRGYFGSATLMAGVLMRDHFRKFSDDPAIAIMAYHTGAGGADKHLRVLSEKGLSATQMEAFNMIDCRHVSYLWAVLALKTIGANPEQYGFSVGGGVDESAYKKTLFHPQSTLPTVLKGI